MLWTGMFNFEIGVTNILEMKAYELVDEEKVQVIKNWLGQDGLHLIQAFTYEIKEKMQNNKRFFLDTKQQIQT